MVKFSKKKLKKIAENYRLSDIYIFGSKVSGYSHPGSDLDIGVKFVSGLPKLQKIPKIYGNLFSDLEQCFSGEKIDLVFIEEAPLHFQFKIIAEGELAYSKDFKASCNFKEKIINYYRDYKFFIDEYFQGALESLKA